MVILGQKTWRAIPYGSYLLSPETLLRMRGRLLPSLWFVEQHCIPPVSHLIAHLPLPSLPLFFFVFLFWALSDSV